MSGFPSRITAFIKDFLMGPDFSEVSVRTQLIHEISPEEAKLILDIATAAGNEAGSRADAWGMEVLKNLVLINGVGLAGVFTLYQVNCLSRSPGSAVVFILGIVAAFVSLMLGWYLQKRASTAFTFFAIRFRAGTAMHGEALACVQALRPIAGTQVAFGILSLVLFVWGAVKIYFIVSSSTGCHP